jgi:hypothetical protein
MQKPIIEKLIGQLDGMIETFDHALVTGRTQRETQASELLKEARLKLVEDMDARYKNNWRPAWSPSEGTA